MVETPNAASQKPGAVITAEGVAMRFGPRTIFKNVTFEVRRGEVFVILGGSGCGKSTLLKLLIGLMAPSQGEIRVLEGDWAKLEGEALRLTALVFAVVGNFEEAIDGWRYHAQRFPNDND
eukprot:gene1934-2412_t